MNITKEELLVEYTKLIEAGENYITLRDELTGKLGMLSKEDEEDIVNDKNFNDILTRADELIVKFDE